MLSGTSGQPVLACVSGAAVVLRRAYGQTTLVRSRSAREQCGGGERRRDERGGADAPSARGSRLPRSVPGLTRGRQLAAGCRAAAAAAAATAAAAGCFRLQRSSWSLCGPQRSTCTSSPRCCRDAARRGRPWACQSPVRWVPRCLLPRRPGPLGGGDGVARLLHRHVGAVDRPAAAGCAAPRPRAQGGCPAVQAGRELVGRPLGALVGNVVETRLLPRRGEEARAGEPRQTADRAHERLQQRDGEQQRAARLLGELALVENA